MKFTTIATILSVSLIASAAPVEEEKRGILSKKYYIQLKGEKVRVTPEGGIPDPKETKKSYVVTDALNNKYFIKGDKITKMPTYTEQTIYGATFGSSLF